MSHPIRTEHHKQHGVSTQNVVANVLDGDIVVSEFELQSRYYVYFRTNILD